MRLVLAPDSRVMVDLQATGLLRAVGHDPTLSAAPGAFELDVPDEASGRFALAVEVRFPVDAVEPPVDIPASDRAQMRDNLRGPGVLDAARWPSVDFRGRYTGTLAGGTLAGDLVVRGAPRPVTIAVAVSRAREEFVTEGSWEGKLTELGIAPFKALFGALKLKDWIRMRLRLRWVPV